jgi:hypothetical protein
MRLLKKSTTDPGYNISYARALQEMLKCLGRKDESCNSTGSFIKTEMVSKARKGEL